LQLDDLWDILGACLKELARSHDQHAVLVLQVSGIHFLNLFQPLLLLLLRLCCFPYWLTVYILKLALASTRFSPIVLIFSHSLQWKLFSWYTHRNPPNPNISHKRLSKKRESRSWHTFTNSSLCRLGSHSVKHVWTFQIISDALRCRDCKCQWPKAGVGKHRTAARRRSVKKLLPDRAERRPNGPKVTGTTDMRNTLRVPLSTVYPYRSGHLVAAKEAHISH